MSAVIQPASYGSVDVVETTQEDSVIVVKNGKGWWPRQEKVAAPVTDVVVSVAVVVGAVWCGQTWFGSDAITGETTGSKKGYTRWEMAAAVGFCYLAPLGGALLARSTFEAARDRSIGTSTRRRVFGVLVGLASIGVGLALPLANRNGLLVCLTELLTCEARKSPGGQNGVAATTGVAYVCVLVFFIALWLPSALPRTSRVGPRCLDVLGGLETRPFGTFARRKESSERRVAKEAAGRRAREAAGAALALAVVSAVFVATGTLPPSPSQFDPETLGAYARSTLKHRDLVAFYAWLAAVALVGALSTKHDSLRKRLAKPVALCCFPRDYERRIVVATGEACFWTSFFFVSVYLAGYWYESRKRIFPSDPVAANLARAAGQAANACLGLLLFPVARNSAVSAAVHVSYERLLKFHSILGYAFVLLVALHGVGFLVASNLTRRALTSFTLASSSAGNKNKNNSPTSPDLSWTVPLALCVAVPSLVVLAATSLYRRVNWDLFKTLHHCALALLIAALWHAPSAWYYALGGLALYLADRGLRFAKATGPVAVVDASVDDRGLVVRLEYALIPAVDQAAAAAKASCAVPQRGLAGSGTTAYVLPEAEAEVPSVAPGCGVVAVQVDDDDDDDYYDESNIIDTLFVVKSHADEKQHRGGGRPCGGAKPWPSDPMMLFAAESGSPTEAGSSETALTKSARRRMTYTPTDPVSFDVGQYAWIRVSSVDSTWRPVAFSSSPHASTATHHIRVTSPDSWSGRLAASVASRGCAGLEINVDGPYGLALEPVVRSKKRVLILAEDRGAFSVASILATLSRDRRAPRRATAPEKARLVWVADDPGLFQAVDRDLRLAALVAAPTAAPLSARLFHANADPDPVVLEDVFSHSLPVVPGRPDLYRESATLVNGLADPADALILVSGPPRLANDAHRAAHHFGIAFYDASTFDL